MAKKTIQELETVSSNSLTTDFLLLAQSDKERKQTIESFGWNILSFFVGQIVMFPNKITDTTMLEHFIRCDGQALKKTDYPILFNRISTIYNKSGTPDDSFCVPFYRGVFLRGLDETGLHNPDKTPLGTTQMDAMQKITGSFENIAQGTASGAFSVVVKAKGHAANEDSGYWKNAVVNLDTSKQVRTSTETRPVNTPVVYYILAK